MIHFAPLPATMMELGWPFHRLEKVQKGGLLLVLTVLRMVTKKGYCEAREGGERVKKNFAVHEHCIKGTVSTTGARTWRLITALNDHNVPLMSLMAKDRRQPTVHTFFFTLKRTLLPSEAEVFDED
jgi:hypothetical protein